VVPEAVTAIEGLPVTLPNDNGFSKAGYTFNGWNTNNAGTGTAYSVNSSHVFNGHTILYAWWNVNPAFELSMNNFTQIDEGEGVFNALGFEPVILDKNVSGDFVEIDLSALDLIAAFIGYIELTPDAGGIITLFASQFSTPATYTLSISFNHNDRPWLGSLTFTVVHEPVELFNITWLQNAWVRHQHFLSGTTVGVTNTEFPQRSPVLN
jgi:uncharacterized repeat protein (TIGR02543 family)